MEIRITIDESLVTTVTRVQAEFGATIIEELVDGWLREHQDSFDGKDWGKRRDVFKTLSPGDQARVLTLLEPKEGARR